MHISIVKQNAQVLFNGAGKNLDCDNNGSITVISWWNFIGRFIKWVQNRSGSVDKRICQAAHETLAEIQKLNQDPKKRFYVRHQELGFTIIDMTYNYSSSYPADYLAEAIQKEPLFNKDPQIFAISQAVLAQKQLYPTHPNNYGKDMRVYHFENEPLNIW